MQQRGGPYNQFDKSKTLPKELEKYENSTFDAIKYYAELEEAA